MCVGSHNCLLFRVGIAVFWGDCRDPREDYSWFPSPPGSRNSPPACHTMPFCGSGCIRDGLRPLPPTPRRNLGLQRRSTLLGPRLVELSEEPKWVESNASRVENGTRRRFLGVPKLS